MTRPSLLRLLADVERETDPRHDPRWERLPGGGLSPGDVAELEKASEGSHWGTTLFDAFTPLDAAACNRIANRLVAGIAADGGRPPADVRPRVTRPRRASASRLRMAAVPLGAALGAAAAAAALVFGLRPEGIPPPMPDLRAEPSAHDPFPDYEIEVTGGDTIHGVRAPAPVSPSATSVSGQPTILAAGGALSIVLRPARATSAPVSLVSCIVRSGRAQPWGAAWERSEQGSFRVQGTREALFPAEPAGQIGLAFAIGRAGALPSCEALVALGAAPRRGPDGVIVLTHRVEIR